MSSASGYGSYDLLTFVTGCSRQRIHLLLPIQASFRVVLSQVCRNQICVKTATPRDDTGKPAGLPDQHCPVVT